MGDTAGEPDTPPFVPPSIQEIAKLFPQLEIIRILGKGGMGAVYQARQSALDRMVALKVLPNGEGTDPGFAERFTREARALARLSHPNIVAVHEFGQAGDLHYFVMEFVDGVNLRQLEQSEHLSPREALRIVPQLCDALQYAHDQGIVHRDIKPENVLLDRKGNVKIADFGLAKIQGHDAGALRLTGIGHVMGTPHYMSPEQVERPLEVDHRADIYSLGVVFYEMLTGELPLGRFGPPSSKVQIDVRLDDVVLRALEKEPDRRYQQVSEVKTRMESISQAPTPSVQPLRAKNKSRWKLFVAGGAVTTLASVLLIFAMRVLFKAQTAPQEATEAARAEQNQLQAQVLTWSPSAPPGENIRGHQALRDAKGLTARGRYDEAQTAPQEATEARAGQNQLQAQVLTWSPSAPPGENIRGDQVLQDAKRLTARGKYDEALLRYLWCYNHALEYNLDSSGVRLLWAYGDWIDLGRRYPKAMQAFVDIRDRNASELAEGKGYFALFMEVQNMNQYLQEDDATVALFKKIRAKAPKFAAECYPAAEEALAQKGEYALCLSYIPDPEAKFGSIRRDWEMLKRIEEKRKEIEGGNMPEAVASAPKTADNMFVAQTRQLIEVLVATGNKSKAEKIHDEAVRLLDDERLQSAVIDAEKKTGK